VFDEKAPKGTIIRVVDEANKPATSEAPKGSTLTLVVSNGPDQRAVPAGLENQPKDAALNALRALRLNPTAKEEVPRDGAQGPGDLGGSRGRYQARVDAPVTVTVSKGPEPRVVPNTVGMTASQATIALEGAVSRSGGSRVRPAGWC
jgi:beta-lactam-binding protein with PASTA domain